MLPNRGTGNLASHNVGMRECEVIRDRPLCPLTQFLRHCLSGGESCVTGCGQIKRILTRGLRASRGYTKVGTLLTRMCLVSKGAQPCFTLLPFCDGFLVLSALLRDAVPFLP